MIGCEVLRDLDAGVGHVGDADNRRRGLRVDEIAKIVETVSDACIAGVVDQNKKLQCGIISTRGNQMVPAKEHIGDRATVCGKVVSTHYAKSSRGNQHS